MLDPSSSPSHPGWPLRNFLALLATWGGAGKVGEVIVW
jgi:hypothetical protein